MAINPPVGRPFFFLSRARCIRLAREGPTGPGPPEKGQAGKELKGKRDFFFLSSTTLAFFFFLPFFFFLIFTLALPRLKTFFPHPPPPTHP